MLLAPLTVAGRVGEMEQERPKDASGQPVHRRVPAARVAARASAVVAVVANGEAAAGLGGRGAGQVAPRPPAPVHRPVDAVPVEEKPQLPGTRPVAFRVRATGRSLAGVRPERRRPLVTDGDARTQSPRPRAPLRHARLAVLQVPGPGEVQAAVADDVIQPARLRALDPAILRSADAIVGHLTARARSDAALDPSCVGASVRITAAGAPGVGLEDRVGTSLPPGRFREGAGPTRPPYIARAVHTLEAIALLPNGQDEGVAPARVIRAREAPISAPRPGTKPPTTRAADTRLVMIIARRPRARGEAR